MRAGSRCEASSHTRGSFTVRVPRFVSRLHVLAECALTVHHTLCLLQHAQGEAALQRMQALRGMLAADFPDITLEHLAAEPLTDRSGLTSAAVNSVHGSTIDSSRPDPSSAQGVVVALKSASLCTWLYSGSISSTEQLDKHEKDWTGAVSSSSPKSRAIEQM